MSFNWAVGRTAKPISTRGADYAHQSTTSPQGFSDLTKGLIPNTTHAAYLRWSYFWRALIKKFHYICLILKDDSCKRKYLCQFIRPAKEHKKRKK